MGRRIGRCGQVEFAVEIELFRASARFSADRHSTQRIGNPSRPHPEVPKCSATYPDDAAIKSDLVAAATSEETYLTDVNPYTDSTTNLATSETVKFSAAGDYTNNTPALTIVSNTDQGYCITGVAASGNKWFYDSGNGGVQPLATTYTCSVSGAS